MTTAISIAVLTVLIWWKVEAIIKRKRQNKAQKLKERRDEIRRKAKEQT